MLGPRTVGSGNVVSELREVPTFQRVRSNGSADVTVVPGDFSVTVTADDNLQQHLTTEVRGDTLVVASQGSYSSRNRISIEISMPELNGIESAGSGDITFGEFVGDDFPLHLSGSGTARFNGVSFQKLHLSIAGSGDIEGAGSVHTLDSRISGSGSIRLENLEATNAKVSIAGSGDVSVSPMESLDVSIAGSGSVYFDDQYPVKVSKRIVGSGSVVGR